jgi:hypothetical protein
MGRPSDWPQLNSTRLSTLHCDNIGICESYIHEATINSESWGVYVKAYVSNERKHPQSFNKWFDLRS